MIGTGSATSATIKGAVQESNTYTDNQIAAKIGSVYKPVGSVNFANLPKILSKTELGNVYNVNDAFEAEASIFADKAVSRPEILDASAVSQIGRACNTPRDLFAPSLIS